MIQYWKPHLVHPDTCHTVLQLCLRLSPEFGSPVVLLASWACLYASALLVTFISKTRVSVIFTWASLAIEQVMRSSQGPAQHNRTCRVVVRVNRTVNRALILLLWRVRWGCPGWFSQQRVGPDRRPGHQAGLSFEYLILCVYWLSLDRLLSQVFILM